MMKFSFSVFFLGWWLTRQRWTARGQSYPKPSISVSPSVAVALGGSFTIFCKSEGNLRMEFMLYKQGYSASWDLLRTKVAEKDEVLFPIVNAQQSHGGIYQCIFRSVHNKRWSDYSDRVHVYITEQFHPKPNISVSPGQVVALGGNLNINCKNEHYAEAVFYLIKEGSLDLVQTQRPGTNEAVFPITNAKASDGGIYWCDYGFISSSDQRYSCFSDKVYIIITADSPVGNSIRLAVAGLVLVVLVLIVAEAVYGWRKGRL